MHKDICTYVLTFIHTNSGKKSNSESKEGILYLCTVGENFFLLPEVFRANIKCVEKKFPKFKTFFFRSFVCRFAGLKY